MRLSKSLLIIVLGVLTFSCKDKEHPEIIIISPAADAHYSAGSWLTIEIEATDDRGIEQVREYIGDEDGTVSTEIVSEGTAYNLKGKVYTGTTGSNLPDGVSGEFWLHVEAIDDEGKVTRDKRRFFVDP